MDVRPAQRAVITRAMRMCRVDLSESGEKRLREILDRAKSLIAKRKKPPAKPTPGYEGAQELRQTHRRLNAAEVQELIKQYGHGLTMNELAKKWGIHRVTVAACLKRAGVAVRRPHLTDQELIDAKALLATGWSMNRLAREHGMDPKTMKRRLSA